MPLIFQDHMLAYPFLKSSIEAYPNIGSLDALDILLAAFTRLSLK